MHAMEMSSTFSILYVYERHTIYEQHHTLSLFMGITTYLLYTANTYNCSHSRDLERCTSCAIGAAGRQ